MVAARDTFLMKSTASLIGKTKPVRAIVPEERSMYWVRNPVRRETWMLPRLNHYVYVLETVAAGWSSRIIMMEVQIGVLCSEPVPGGWGDCLSGARDGLIRLKSEAFLQVI